LGNSNQLKFFDLLKNEVDGAAAQGREEMLNGFVFSSAN